MAVPLLTPNSRRECFLKFESLRKVVSIWREWSENHQSTSSPKEQIRNATAVLQTFRMGRALRLQFYSKLALDGTSPWRRSVLARYSCRRPNYFLHSRSVSTSPVAARDFVMATAKRGRLKNPTFFKRWKRSHFKIRRSHDWTISESHWVLAHLPKELIHLGGAWTRTDDGRPVHVNFLLWNFIIT